MTYEGKLKKFTEGKRFHSAQNRLTGRSYLSQQTGNKSHNCAACGSKRAYFLEGLEDEEGNFYWVGSRCARIIMWLQDEVAQGQVAQLKAEQQEKEEILKAARQARGLRQEDRDIFLEREAKTLARLAASRPQELR